MPGAELDRSTIDTIKATAPVVAENAVTICGRMYEILFDEYPDQKGILNQSHQRKQKDGSSSQAKALAASVIAYASNIDNLGALSSAVELITEKHVSLHIQPEQYVIVGGCLLKAIKEVLGDAATDDIVEEWKKAFFFLADLFISIEKKKYDEQLAQEGGWVGFKELKVDKKEEESKGVTSFYFVHTDGSKIPDNFRPGQFLAIKIPKSAFGGKYDHDFCRNYSLSCSPGLGYLRCSIGKTIDENAEEETPYYGVVSNYMHDHVNEGDKVLVSMPRGHFKLEDADTCPLVMVSAGTGITPILSMLDCLVLSPNKNPERKIISIQVNRSTEYHPMKTHIDMLVQNKLIAEAHVFYTRDSNGIGSNLQNTTIHSGRPSVESLQGIIGEDLGNAEFYLCGPTAFMKAFEEILGDLGVEKNKMHCERFGPELGN